MIYLAFHKPHLKDSLNYVVRNNIIFNLKENGLSFTLNSEEHRDVILFTSAYDFCYELKNVKSSDKIHILALSDPNDIVFSKDGVSLTTDALNAYQKAVDRIIKNCKVFEINTGAISRGCRTTPYPSDEIRDYIRQKGGKFILSSDSHQKETLCFEFDKFRSLV